MVKEVKIEAALPRPAAKSMLALSAMAALAGAAGVTGQGLYNSQQPKASAGTGKRAHITGRDNGKTKLRIQRNAVCPGCDSGMKYKNCCGKPK